MDGYAELRAFRATHPYRSLTVGGVEWKYIAGPAAPRAEDVSAGPDGAKPALLVLGGGFSFGDSAFRTVTAFEPRFRVISPSYPPVRTMAELVAGIAAILDAEGIPSASVFGHSLGAGVAHAFSRRYPQRVDRLVLSGFGLYTRGHTRLAGGFVRVFSLLPKSALAAFYRPRIARLVAGAADDDVLSSAPTQRTSLPPTPRNRPWRAWRCSWTWRSIRTVTPRRPSGARRTCW